ncbi:hypothetical protein A5750_12760 [Mycobacterium sp. 852002-51613_SCH5001154]|uniref:hypothetical protein n=2 Tax=unclassified Mycobacterium TaxID=2642494 RepID=UPI0007FD5E66|nr:hypothetical protein [Mycobacterium sp. 852014-52450_SCH5900713]OBF74551.1 hypothetical protein A5750_12760 [Mycobacterium sp. 852002-51613_SCH5001154]OBG01039.1 hypothetical protein A5773_03105 [Mycobacterium sp. 852014-52450_SCH5900713]
MTLAIYRDLRVAMVVLMVMLAAGVIIERISAPCWQSAISTYYYTSAHSIVVAALLALGTLFIIYRGSTDTEDVLLTLAGVSALTAAIVPQPRPNDLCPGPANLPLDFDDNAKAAMLPNVWAVAIALGLGYLVIWSVMLDQWRRGRPPRKRRPGGIVSLCVFWLIMVLGLIALIFFRDTFKEYAHGAAAVLLLSAFIATTFCTAYVVGREDPSKSPHQRGYKRIYWGIAWLMLATLIAVLWVHYSRGLGGHWGLLAEVALILEFAAYWVVQTIDLWTTPDRIMRFTKRPPPCL